MDICWSCKVQDGRPVYSDPCCSAPDCEYQNAVVHYECAPRWVRKEIDGYRNGENEGQ